MDVRPSADLEHALDGHSERIDPEGVPVGILSVHRVRYDFAAPLCADRTVLDVACGAGYGSDIVGHCARTVTGVDIEPLAVDYARRRYGGAKVRFVAGDAAMLAFADASFEAVVCFETIEHVPDGERFLREVCRVLAPGGTFVVSTPRVLRTNLRPANPHHVIEYAVEDFRALLCRYFTGVEVYGQVRVQSGMHFWLQKLDVLGLRHRVPARLRRAVDRGLGTVPFEDMASSDQRIVTGSLSRASVVIAICRRGDGN